MLGLNYSRCRGRVWWVSLIVYFLPLRKGVPISIFLGTGGKGPLNEAEGPFTTCHFSVLSASETNCPLGRKWVCQLLQSSLLLLSNFSVKSSKESYIIQMKGFRGLGDEFNWDLSLHFPWLVEAESEAEEYLKSPP